MAEMNTILKKIDERAGVAWITLNRPEKKNALSRGLMAELITAVKYKLPVKIIINKNDTLGQIKWEQMVFLGNPEFGCELQPIDFASLARACGTFTSRVSRLPKQAVAARAGRASGMELRSNSPPVRSLPVMVIEDPSTFISHPISRRRTS